MRLTTTLTLTLTASLASTACFAQPDSTPTEVFDQVWTDFDQYYGLFEVKGIDWDQTYTELRPLVDDSMSDAELHALLVDMLEPLADKHVTLYPASNPELPTWSVDLIDGAFPLPPLSIELVEREYLSNERSLPAGISVGRLSDELGYLHIPSFDAKRADYRKALDEALDKLEGVTGIVVDVRDNPGGYDPNAQYVAGRFASERRLYMTVRKRSGPEHDQFTAPIDWYVEPTGDRQFTGPVVLLTTYATQSAGETFCLAMRERDELISVGDTTAGAFSDNILREAGNGWAYTISVGDYRASDGESYEGVGLSPDVEIVNTAADLAAGRDRVLQAAIEQLELMLEP